MSKSITYQPDVDGLRAIAISAVLGFHFFPEYMPAGFLGVDVFFVISGYLITSIIRNELDAGTFTLRGFWERRARRILPPLIFLIICLLFITWALSPYQHFQYFLSKQSAYALAMISNLKASQFLGDYWGPSAESVPLLHTWSLSVEEQFYLIFPFLLLIAAKKLGPRATSFGLAALFFASLAICVGNSGTTHAFYFIQYRSWELLAGALAAYSLKNRWTPNMGETARKFVSGIALTAVLVSLLAMSPGGFPGWKTTIPVLCTALYIATRPDKCLVGSLMSSRPVVLWGKMSYSVYLWHWPAWTFGLVLCAVFDSPILMPISLASGFALALVSYFVVEKIGKQTQRIYIWLSGSMGVAIAMIFFGTRIEYPVDLPKLSSWHGKLFNLQPAPAVSGASARAARIETYESKQPRPVDWWRHPVILGETPPAVLILGDSHGVMWGREVFRICQENRQGLASFASLGVFPGLGDLASGSSPPGLVREEFDLARLAYVEATKPKVIILAMRYDLYKEREMEGIVRLLAEIRRRSPESTILIPEQLPILPITKCFLWEIMEWRDKLDLGARTRIAVPTWEKTLMATDALRSAVGHLKGVEIVPLSIEVSPDSRVKVVSEDGKLIFHDEDHFSSEGAELAGANLRRRLGELLASRSVTP